MTPSPGIPDSAPCSRGELRCPLRALSPRGRAAAALLALSLAVLSAGCSTGRINVWPLFFREVRDVPAEAGGTRRVTTTEVFPFFERQSTADGSWYALRPFYNYQHDNRTGRSRVQYLWPLGLDYRDGDYETQHRLFPFFHYIRVRDSATGKHSVHAHLLQIIRWGNDDEFGPYFAFFPLGGVTHGVIGDTWSFALFPLFSYFRHGEYRRYDFPWPILGYGHTPDGKRVTYRLFPFYVYERKDRPAELRVVHRVLWFIARWGTVDRRGRFYYTVVAVSPLFSTICAWDREGNLLSYRASVLGFSFGSKGEHGRETGGWSALWSLARKTSEPRKDEFRILPFYWRTTLYRTSQKDIETSWVRQRVLWPFVWLDRDRMHPPVEKRALVVAPLYWQYTDIERDPGGRDRLARRITLFPLFTWQQDADGGRDFWIVSHGWTDLSKGFKRNYRAFFDLFQYHRSQKDGTEVRLLSRLVHYRATRRGRYFSLGPLFTYDGTGEVVGEDGSYVSGLLGLVKYSWGHGRRRWRIFYIPLGG